MRKKRITNVAITACMLAVLSMVISCSKSKEDIIVAKIKDRTISLAHFEEAYTKVDPTFLPKKEGFEGLLEFLNTMIKKEVMAIKADELGYDKDPYVVQGMEAYRKIGVQAGYLKFMVADKIEITDEDLRDYYDKWGTVLRVKQVLVDLPEEADEVYDLLVSGENFEEVCKRYSKGPDAEVGGKVLNARFGTFEPTFQEELFSHDVGGVTKPIISRYGYFVIKVLGKSQPKRKSFEELKPEIEQLVHAHKQMILTREMSDAIRDKHGLEWFDGNIGIIMDALPEDRPLSNPPPRSAEVYPLLEFAPSDLDKPIVKYMDKTITVADFSDMYDRANFFQRPRREYRYGGIKKFFLDYIMNELVAIEMEESKIEEHPEVARMLKSKQEEFMINKLYQDLVDGQTTVSQGDILAYYNDNFEQFRAPEQRRFGVVLTGDLESAKEAYELIKAGEHFGAIATKYSIDEQTKKNGGETDFLALGEQYELDEVGFSMENVGDVSEPFETSRGWMVLKLYERRPERIMPLEEIRTTVESTLRTMKNEERLNELLAKWRAELSIEIYEDNLRKADVEPRYRPAVDFS